MDNSEIPPLSSFRPSTSEEIAFFAATQLWVEMMKGKIDLAQKNLEEAIAELKKIQSHENHLIVAFRDWLDNR